MEPRIQYAKTEDGLRPIRRALSSLTGCGQGVHAVAWE